MKLLSDSAAAHLIPSIAIDALLARRDAAVAHLRTIAEAVKSYQETGESIWLRKSDEQHQQVGDAAPFCYREPVEPRPHSGWSSFGSQDWLAVAMRAVDASIWDHLLSESGLWTFFDSKAREEWRKQIDERETPPLTPDNIRATFEILYAQRGTFFERGVVQLFRKLSWDYKTNKAIAFGKRIIIRHVTSSFGHNTDALDDLDRALHILDGKPEPDHRSSIKRQLPDSYYVKVCMIETPYLRLKTFKNGNGHVEFLRPDLVDKLNLVLARHGPRDLARANEDRETA